MPLGISQARNAGSTLESASDSNVVRIGQDKFPHLDGHDNGMEFVDEKAGDIGGKGFNETPRTLRGEPAHPAGHGSIVNRPHHVVIHEQEGCGRLNAQIHMKLLWFLALAFPDTDPSLDLQCFDPNFVHHLDIQPSFPSLSRKYEGPDRERMVF